MLELPLFPLPPLLFAAVGTRAVLLFLSLLSAVEEVVERHPVGQNDLRFDVEPYKGNKFGAITLKSDEALSNIYKKFFSP